MLFNTACYRDFMPEVSVDGKYLEVVEEYKLLGVMISSNLKWETNTSYTTKRAFSRLWMLRRLKNLGLNTPSLIKIFTTQIRSVLEFGAVTWHSMITKENCRTIQRVQKSALAIIHGPIYNGYASALHQTNLQTAGQHETENQSSKTQRLLKSPIPFLTELLNNDATET